MLLILLAILNTGCQTGGLDRTSKNPPESMYQLVVSDLAKKEPHDARFTGAEVWIAPKFAVGNSLIYSWGNDIDVNEELIDALAEASQKTGDFPATEQFGPNARVTEIESFHDLHYYCKHSKPVTARCLVQFWRPGVSADGKRAIVRFRYGPSPHGAVGTYVLQYTDSGWRICASTISYYV